MNKLVILATGLAASAGFAQPPASAPAANAGESHDPNEMICRRVQMLGSRLNAARMCMTRAQWDLQQRTDRMEIERAQTRRVIAH